MGIVMQLAALVLVFTGRVAKNLPCVIQCAAVNWAAAA